MGSRDHTIVVVRTSSDAATMTDRGGHHGGSSGSRGSEELLLGGGYRGRSTLSLCSCDADKYQNGYPIDPHRALLYQYSLDRKRPKHTYTCEQNANILLRLERLSSLKRNDGKKSSQSRYKPRKPPPDSAPSIIDQISKDIKPCSIPDLNQIDLYDSNHIAMSEIAPKCRKHFQKTKSFDTKTMFEENVPYFDGKTNSHQYDASNSRHFEKSCHFVDTEQPITPLTPIISRHYHRDFNMDRHFECNDHHFEMFDTGSYIPHRTDIVGSDSEPELASLDISRHLAGCPSEARGYTHLEEDRCFPPAPDVTRATGLPGHSGVHGVHSSHLRKAEAPWRHRPPPPSHGSNTSTSSGGSSRLELSGRHWWVVTGILLIAGAAGVGVPLALRVAEGAPLEERLQAATRLLEAVPLIDGHNDLPWNIRKFLHNQLKDFKFNGDLRNTTPWSTSAWSHTDLLRLRQGRVGAQFWAAYVPCEAQYRDAVQITLEQIDVIRRLTEMFHPPLTPCFSTEDIRAAHAQHQVCSLIGVEGGHSLGGSLAVLRILYSVGVRYLTLTSSCHTPWADSSLADAPGGKPLHGGLTQFGKTVVKEMNRLGMIVDLSHVSMRTAKDAMAISKAPVIFSHSSAHALCNSSRNVHDTMLRKIALNKGIIMVNFYSQFLTCKDTATVADAVAHINHIRSVAGVDFVGLGAGYDGINYTPVGLEDVSTYPLLFAELLGAGWSEEDLIKLAGQNFLRVLTDVERVRDEQRKSGVTPYEHLPQPRNEALYNCTKS